MLRSFVESGVEREDAEKLLALQAEALERCATRQTLDAVDASDAEEAMLDALEDRGIVQVSMNLTNFEKTPIFRVFETVKREAARYGVAVLEGLLAAGQRDGSVRAGSVELLARTVFLMVQSFVISGQIMADAPGGLAALDGELARALDRYLAA